MSSQGDASLTTTGPLQIGKWNVAGALQLNVTGSGAVTDALAANRSSFAGFNTKGTGWNSTTQHGSATVTSSSSDELLNVTLESGSAGTEAWPSQVEFTKAPVQLSGRFVLGFIYQSSATGSRVALNLGSSGQPGMALVLNLGSADGSGSWIDFLTASEIETATSGQSPGSVLLNSNHPIQVTLSYSSLSRTLIAILTDTGSFHYSHISPRTFDICRQCVEAGVDPPAAATT
mgnify:CR=1 FL=1